MKRALRATIAVLVLSALLTPGANAEPATPSAADIAEVVKDVATLDYMIKDMTPVATANVVVRVISNIRGSKTLSAAAQKKAIALVVARAVFYKPEQAAEMMAQLVRVLKNDVIISVVVSAAIIAAEGNSAAVFDAMVAQITNDPGALKLVTAAASSPVEPLTAAVVKDVQDMIRVMKLAAVPVIPAQEPTTVPLVPPIPGGRYPGQ